jgi:hypothetical protein
MDKEAALCLRVEFHMLRHEICFHGLYCVGAVSRYKYLPSKINENKTY